MIRRIKGFVPLGNVSGSVALDASKGNFYTLTLTGNATFVISNVKPGCELYVQVQQDGTGAHTVSFSGGQTITGGTASDQTVNSAAGAFTQFSFVGTAQPGGAPGSVAIIPQASVAAGATGRLLAVTEVAATGTFTTGASTNTVRVRMVGGGGGGGGAAAGANQAGVGGGGGAGSYNEAVLATAPNTALTCTVGPAGTAGANTGGNGGNGGLTSIVVGSTTISAGGGSGGTGSANLAAPASAAGGAGGSQSGGNGLFNSNEGAAGSPGIVVVATNPAVGFGGVGGSSAFSGGAAPSSGGRGFGIGGGGAFAPQNNSVLGGAGNIGVIIVEEYS